MGRQSTIGLGQDILIGVILVVVVALATILFSLLGAISCSALIGMMMGAMRRWRWPILPASLVFPFVVMAVLQFTQANITVAQRWQFSLLCLVAFWISFLLTFGLVSLEARNPAPQPASAERPHPECAAAPDQPADADAPGAREQAAEAPSLPAGPPVHPRLAELQGTWWHDPAASNGDPERHLLEILRDHLILKVSDGDGHLQVVARALLQPEQVGPFQVLRLLSDPDGERSTDQRGLSVPDTWIYRIVDGTLRVACHFDPAATDDEPRSEKYVRSDRGRMDGTGKQPMS